MTRSNLANLVSNISFFQAKENKRTFAQFATNAISQKAQKHLKGGDDIIIEEIHGD